jgi:lysophospholipase L1-like esterase
MKRILCYGDSNTWGYDPEGKDRFAPDKRWPGVLGKILGNKFCIIEEGLGGRTTVWDDPIESYKSGRDYLIPCLETHRPLDLVILMLGTNDLKKRFSLSAYDVAQGIAVLVKIIQDSIAGPNWQGPPILLLVPPPITVLTEFAELFEGAESKSLKLPEHYQRIARQMGCVYLDTGTIIRSSPLDGIHLEEASHFKLGEAVALKVKEILAV